jgi:hypothetical protein
MEKRRAERKRNPRKEKVEAKRTLESFGSGHRFDQPIN